MKAQISDTTAWDIFRDIERINKWLDNNTTLSEYEDAMRVMKVGEECGEAIAAYIGMTGQNPRKGITHTQSDLCLELADVAITAMCAIAHFNPRDSNKIVAMYMSSKISQIIKRSNIPE